MKTVREIYDGSDGEATRGLYDKLAELGNRGVVALNLFRASKASQRAKVYRRRYKGEAYEKKNWSLKLLCDALLGLEKPWEQSGCSTPGCGYPDGKPCIGCGLVISHGIFMWGWKEDPTQEFHKWVLYVDLPTGQVSFHSAVPLSPERYPSEWDGQHVSRERIVAYVDHVLNGTPVSLILQKCTKCGSPVPIGVISDLCPPCAVAPASVEDFKQLALLPS